MSKNKTNIINRHPIHIDVSKTRWMSSYGSVQLLASVRLCTALLPVIFIASLLLSSCRVNKYLSPSEKLVDEVDIIIEADHENFNKDRIRSGMAYYIQQNKNGKFMWIPKEWIYLRHDQPADTNRYDRIMRNVFGEAPIIYDEELTSETAGLMERWLKFNKGFYQAKVNYKVKDKGIKREVTYIANLGKRYKYGSITFYSLDTAIIEQVEQLWNYEQVHPGSFVDRDAYNVEISRITNILQNRGYANFASKYFDIKGDSTNISGTIDLIVEVFPPEGDNYHRKYNVGDIAVYTDYHTKQDTFGMTSQVYNHITYFKESQEFLVKPDVLDRLLLFKRGELVQKDLRTKSFNKLSNLSTYRFTTITPSINEADSTVIDYDILLSPHPYKWIVDGGYDFNYSTLGRNSSGNSLGRNLIGLSLNGQLQNRNLLGGSEYYAVSAEVGSQIEIAKPARFRTFNYSLSNYLEYPIFKDHFGQAKLLNAIGFISNRGYHKLQRSAQSTINLSVSNTSIRDFYRIFIINGSYGYKMTDKVDRSLNINTLGLTLNQYDLSPAFLEFIQNNDLLLNTFQDNLFTGLLFRNMLYSRNGFFKESKWQWAYYASLEGSGAEILGANKLYNALSGSNDTWKIGNDRFNFAKFGKIELDGRLYYAFNKNNTLAYRVNAGIASTFGGDRTVPFIKQFDAGGPNSMRGWAPRELGPGANKTLADRSLVIPFQKGDIKLETNFEYRFPIYWLFKGAIYTDIGNVWLLKDDGNGGQFTKNFVNQLAVASGWGLRFDVDYFLIRFDFGYRLRSPYEIEDEKGSRHWSTWQDIRRQRLGNIQVAVNHAF